MITPILQGGDQAPDKVSSLPKATQPALLAAPPGRRHQDIPRPGTCGPHRKPSTFQVLPCATDLHTLPPAVREGPPLSAPSAVPVPVCPAGCEVVCGSGLHVPSG